MNKINLMSDDIGLQNQTIDITTMSGDVQLTNCTGDVETMSGDIDLLRHNGRHIVTMSGDIDIIEGEIGRIESMSGDISTSRVKCNKLMTTCGDVTIKDSEFNIIECTELFGENSHIETLYINNHSTYVYKEISGFRWWNPFTWGTTQIQNCGNNSTCIQCDGDIIIDNTTNTKYYKGECKTKSTRPRIFILPDTIKVDKVIFNNGRKDNILKAKHKTVVENGKWQKV